MLGHPCPMDTFVVFKMIYTYSNFCCQVVLLAPDNAIFFFQNWYFLSHLLVAGCDIGVRFSVRPSVPPSVCPSVNIYVDVRHLCQS